MSKEANIHGVEINGKTKNLISNICMWKYFFFSSFVFVITVYVNCKLMFN